jgi:hypothetical protein
MCDNNTSHLWSRWAKKVCVITISVWVVKFWIKFPLKSKSVVIIGRLAGMDNRFCFEQSTMFWSYLTSLVHLDLSKTAIAGENLWIPPSVKTLNLSRNGWDMFNMSIFEPRGLPDSCNVDNLSNPLKVLRSR